VSAEQPFPNDFQDRVGFRKHLAVREAQHVETMLLQYAGPRRIASLAFIVVVLATVELDDQHALDAGKVGEEWSHRMLAAEFVAGQAAVAQLRPEEALGVGGRGAELTGSRVDPHPSPLPQAGEGA
jgi:hypothetical protein